MKFNYHKLSNSKKPNIVFFPTASSEDEGYIINFYKAFSKLIFELLNESIKFASTSVSVSVRK